MDGNSNLHVDRTERRPGWKPLSLITLSFASQFLHGLALLAIRQGMKLMVLILESDYLHI